MEQRTGLSNMEQAAEWFVRLHCNDLNIAECFRYVEWLKQSPQHVREAIEMGRIYSLLYSMRGRLFFTNEDNISNVVKLTAREPAEAPPPRERDWVGRFAAAVVVLIATALLGLVAKQSWFDHTIETQASEWRNVALNDGSLVSIGPRTRLVDDLGARRRLIHLSPGAAMFRVAKDPGRPFIVDAELAYARATGTRFAVDRREHEVIVTVEEGTVVVSKSLDGSNGVSLSAGDQVRVSGDWPVAVKQIDLQRELGWATRKLWFRHVPLRFAVEEFNRLNRVQLVVDPVLADDKILGIFLADDPQAFVDAVARGKPGAVQHHDGDVLQLSMPKQAAR